MNISKELREAMGLTVSGCAKQMSMAVSTLKFYENGGGVTARSVEKIAAFFGVSVEQLEGKEPLNVALWAMKNRLEEDEKEQEEQEQEEQAVPALPQQLSIHQLGIKQIVKTSHAAVNYYLEEGWILLDTTPMKQEDEGFFCLIGNTEIWSNEDFERIKNKNSKPPKSYWMTRK